MEDGHDIEMFSIVSSVQLRRSLALTFTFCAPSGAFQSGSPASMGFDIVTSEDAGWRRYGLRYVYVSACTA